eukprot:5169187-Prorocentrum_lima.AAC.1
MEKLTSAPRVPYTGGLLLPLRWRPFREAPLLGAVGIPSPKPRTSSATAIGSLRSRYQSSG